MGVSTQEYMADDPPPVLPGVDRRGLLIADFGVSAPEFVEELALPDFLLLPVVVTVTSGSFTSTLICSTVSFVSLPAAPAPPTDFLSVPFIIFWKSFLGNWNSQNSDSVSVNFGRLCSILSAAS